MFEMILVDIINFIVGTVASMGYFGIFILMLLESSFFPFPSEVVMIPAGYLAATGEMNIFLVVLFGVLGSIVGAVLNYAIGYYVGRPFVIKYGKYVFLNEKNFRNVERLFNKYGEVATGIGRLIPGVRQYISFPPGITKMRLPNFIVFTAIGATIWVTILSLLGYFVGQNQALLKYYLHQITYALIVISVIVIVMYILYKKYILSRK